MPGRPTNLDYSRARHTALAVGADGVVLTFLSIISSFLSPFLWETARSRLKYCLKGPLSPKQPTNLQKTIIERKGGLLINQGTNTFILFLNSDFSKNDNMWKQIFRDTRTVIIERTEQRFM